MTANSNEVFVRPTRYEVTAWPGPADAVNRPHYILHVEWRGNDNWCVTDGFGCYRTDGHHEHEPLPTSRETDFNKRTRFPLDEALQLARRIAPTMTINGKSAADCWKWEKAQRSDRD